MRYVSNFIRSIREKFYEPSVEQLATVIASPVRVSIVSVLSEGPMNYEELREKVNADLREKGYFDDR